MRYLITGGSGFIGTNYIAHLIRLGGNEILNMDYVEVKVPSQKPYHVDSNILHTPSLFAMFESFKPDYVIHLAARTDANGVEPGDYYVNYQGTSNVLEAVKRTPSVKRVIIASSQYVHQTGGQPKHDEDFAPLSPYSESKVRCEKITRAADVPCVWTIARPTNIWGPWHSRYPNEFWRVVAAGKYRHPKRAGVIRSYGYVGNVVSQFENILAVPAEQVNKQVIYLGDEPLSLIDWVNGFSIAQTGHRVREVPYALMKALAVWGDLVKLFGGSFPIFSSRLKSMTTSNPVDMRKTFSLFGTPPYSLAQGIEETIAWMKEYSPDLINEH